MLFVGQNARSGASVGERESARDIFKPHLPSAGIDGETVPSLSLADLSFLPGRGRRISPNDL